MGSEFDDGALGRAQAGGAIEGDPAAEVEREDELDPIVELAELAQSLQAHISWLIASGASGLPRDPDARARVQLQERQLAASAEREPESAPVAATTHAPRPQAAVEFAPAPLPSAARPPAATRPTEGAAKAPATAAPPVVNLAASLDELEGQVAECRACGLCERRKQTVFARGTGRGRLCFVGEGPGADEDAEGEPFVGKAGQLLDKMIAGMGFSRDEVYVCNVVKCRPPDNRKPTADEMAACAPYLHRQLELIDPEVIVALGATALEGLLGHVGKITQLRGTFRLYRGRIAVMPTFHPAYVLRSPEARGPVWSDLKKVVQHMGRTLPPRGQ